MLLRWISLTSVVCVTVATLSYAADPVDHLRSDRQVAAMENAPKISAPQNPVSQDVNTSMSQSQVPDDITPAELIAFLRQLEQQVGMNTQAISNASAHTQTLGTQLA